MTHIEGAILSFSIFIKKLFTYNTGALVVVATPGGITLAGVVNKVMEDTNLKDIVLPIAVAGICLIFYFVWFSIDFLTGLKAAKVQAKGERGWFKSGKAWSSLIKATSIVMLISMMAIFSSLSALAGISFMSTVFLCITGIFGLMASMFDMISIGENQELISGKKAKIYSFIESCARAVEEGFTGKIKSWFTAR